MSLLDTAFSIEALHESCMEIEKQLDFKSDVQNYILNEMEEIDDFRTQYKNKTFHFTKTKQFIIKERGKIRLISPVCFRDRVVIHSFCKNILMKILFPYIIYDNSSSIKGRGVDHSLNRTKIFLHKYFNKHHTNEGYVLQVDYTKYFDNLDHEIIIELIREKIPDEEVIDFLRLILKEYEKDVSYLTEEEYLNYKNIPFNSLEYYTSISSEIKTGEKILRRSIGIGNEVSQICGIFYLYKLDNYIKIVAGFKYYSRYMDDLLIISDSKQALKDVLEHIIRISSDLKLFINLKKTKITKLNKGFIFLKVKFILAKTGKVIMIRNKDTFIRERRKLKKLKVKMENNEITYKDIENQFKGWRGSIARIENGTKHSKRYKNYRQLARIDKLYNEMFIEPFIRGEVH